MSGDVQPRKRKDKRRKKEESLGPEEPAIQPTVAPVKESSDDFNIHVHNDHGTGGGICAKLVFFVLLSILAVLIGMIFIEKRGLTDLDTAPTESRFAQIFDGWVDESFNHHEDDHHEVVIDDHDEHDDHEESEELAIDDEEHHGSEEEGHDEEDEHDEEHEEEEEIVSEEVEEEQAEETEEQADETEEQADETEEQVTEEQVSEEQEEEQEEEQVSEEQEETQEEEEEVEEEEDQSVVDEASNENDGQEEDNIDTTEDDGNDDDHEEDEIINEIEEEADDDNQSNQIDEEEVNENFDEDVSRENEIIEEESVEEIAEDQNEDDEEVIDNTAGEEEALQEEAEKQEEAQEENTGVVLKIGVGVALVVVAHIVLVRKWRSGQASVDKTAKEEEIISDLSRRNTIVAPVPLEQIENDIEDEYSEEEEEEESEEEIIIEPVKSKSTYMQLQSTYSRSLPLENVSNKTTLESKPAPRVFYYDEHQGEDEEDVEEEEEEEEEEEVEEDVEEENEQNEQEEEIEEDEEGEDVEEEEISDVDDEELLKKLEAKYGKLPSQKDNKADQDDDRFSSWKRIKVLPDSAEESEGSDDGHWAKKESIPADYQQKMKLAESNLRDNAELSLNLYTNLMETLPNNVYVKHGRAKALDQLAEKKKSNELLQDAISSYMDLLQHQNISDEMYLDVAERCIDRIRFRGHYNRAVEVHKQIINRFPDTPKYKNQLAVTLLTSNRLAEAKTVLLDVLSRWPNDGFAQVHYGFILKTRDNDLTTAIQYLKSGIESRETGVIDGRFYFHLGDALTRIGKNNDALKIYEDGVKHKVFLSKYQRSLYNIDRLTARPWWSVNQTPYTWFFQLLEDKWTIIRNEGLALLNKAGFFKDEAENLRDTGEWKQFELFARGQKFIENCKKCPETCRLIENLPDAKNCRRGQVKFSVMHPGTHVWPHCGPSNCRLRAHLGLKVPPKTFIRVAEETRSWSEGKVFIFDDSFEHEVWHNGTDMRLVLIIDVWHPELTAHEKRFLPAI